MNRQANMDYAFVHAVLYWIGKLLVVLLFYDIACQYHKHLWERIRRVGNSLCLPENTKVQFGIGGFHVHGHNKECYANYASLFIPGAGQPTDEIVETLWVLLDEVSGQLRGMGTGHRQESMDMHMADSNWKKTIRMCTYFDASCQ